MYEADTTIAAVSSPAGWGGRSIIRVTGPDTFSVLATVAGRHVVRLRRGIHRLCIRLDDEFGVEAVLYLYRRPRSYTGEDLAELHLPANLPVTEQVFERLLRAGAKAAGPGEFTARAYLNGKLDLTQAEAVAEVVASGNRFQLAAAQRLLAGRLAEVIAQVRQRILEVLSLLEAGLDFSTEEIELISPEQAAAELSEIREGLRQLQTGGVSDEMVVDMPTVGVAGAGGAGKSSLVNALLGRPRSIVSQQGPTTRDVLTGVWRLESCECILFDCAGLTRKPGNILEQLGCTAAISALNSATVVVFCVDVCSDDLGADVGLCGLIRPGELIWTATKTDRLSAAELDARLAVLSRLVNGCVLPTSARTGFGIDRLQRSVQEALVKLRPQAAETADRIAVTERHRRAVRQAVEYLCGANDELLAGRDEVASMLLRGAWQVLSEVERQGADEAILERIFSRFCVGK